MEFIIKLLNILFYFILLCYCCICYIITNYYYFAILLVSLSINKFILFDYLFPPIKTPATTT